MNEWWTVCEGGVLEKFDKVWPKLRFLDRSFGLLSRRICMNFVGHPIVVCVV